MRILAVDDDQEITGLLKAALEDERYVVETASSGEEGEALAADTPFDLIILDVGLPGKDGVEVCRSLRINGINTPILMLTGRTTSSDQVAGLDSGADDYLAKPVELPVLRARVRALLRREPQVVPDQMRLGDFLLDLRARRVWKAGREIALTAKEYAILEHLAHHAGFVVTRLDLEQHCWGVSFAESSNVVDQHVKNLRRKLGESVAIETVRGSGYRLKSDRRGEFSREPGI